MNDWSQVIRGIPAAELIKLLGQVQPKDYLVSTSMARLHIVRVNGDKQPVTIGYVNLDPKTPGVVFLEGSNG